MLQRISALLLGFWIRASITLATPSDASTAPQIVPSASFQPQAVEAGQNTSFTVTATGSQPLSFQWRLDGHDLLGQNNQTISISAADASSEGDYTVAITNPAGSVTSTPMHLWVVPPASEFIKANFTNGGQWLPYFYLLPKTNDPARKLPLLCFLHGSPRDETSIVPPPTPIPGVTYLAEVPAFKILASLKAQQTDPMILLWPSRRAGDNEWTASYVKLISALLDELVGDFNLDTNRVYLEAGSEGVHGAWDLAALRPGQFAGARFMDGWQGTAAARALVTLPLWVFHSAADEEVDVSNSRTLVRGLRVAGGNPIYTEYKLGAHVNSILTGTQTPASLAWLVAHQETTPSAQGPLVSIETQAGGASFSTGATQLDLAGEADALDQPVTNVAWEDTTNGSRGNAAGSAIWDVSAVPLAPGRTNLILVTATTGSWSPLLGGTTTFNAVVKVLSVPIETSLTVQGATFILDWSGGVPPFGVEAIANLGQGTWRLLATNAVPPITVDAAQGREFFRISGR